MGVPRPKVDSDIRKKQEISAKFKTSPISRNWVCESPNLANPPFCAPERSVSAVPLMDTA